MKTLILIMSCVKHELNGYNQVMRDTWLRGLDYKFFIGNGTPTGEDESLLLKTYNESGIFKNKITEDPDISLMTVKSDHVILNIPDDYAHSIYKFREACRWAVENNYDYVFQVLTDTFVVPERLLSSGFEQHDYVGTANNERTAIGGFAIWLSRKSLNLLVNAPVTMWCHDGWAGKVLTENGIPVTHDDRYTNLGPNLENSAELDNDIIACHIANTPTIYDPQVMVQLHKRFERIK